MRSFRSKPWAVQLLSSALVFASSSATRHETFSLGEFQRMLRTGLDSELSKIVHDHHDRDNNEKIELKSDQRSLHSKRRSYMRPRTNNDVPTLESQDSSERSQETSPFSSREFQVWNNLVDHAWNAVETVKIDLEDGFVKTANIREAHPFPFLVCASDNSDEKKGLKENVSFQNVITRFGKQSNEALLVSSSRREVCLILTTTALKVNEVMESYHGEQIMAVMPILDVMKIHVGTIDEVSSPGWSVPFIEQLKEIQGDNRIPKNETEAVSRWERMIVVDFVPGVGGMKEEAELLDFVNNIMGDIQDMGEIGWLRKIDDEEVDELFQDESLAAVPSISDMFSLTALGEKIEESAQKKNTRIQFWEDALQNGIESEHVCTEMFSTLFVYPTTGYYSFDLVLNPSDGPPPQNYESSASNPACVISLIAALSVHPYVLSVKANFPIYHGWNVAQQLDSA